MVFAHTLRSALISLLLGGCYQHARRDAPASPPSKVDRVSVPAATFTLGDNGGEPDEYPELKVTLKAFRIDRMEVSNADYRACIEAKACDPNPYMDDDVLGRPTAPVVGVTWDDAAAYCAWRQARLPTEAEWEHAAKGTDLRKWPWTGPFDISKANTNAADDPHPKTAPVDAYPDGASAYGVLNMAGNVTEWTADFYDPTWYRTAKETTDPKGPDSGRERAVRGGSYADGRHLTRVSARRGKLPTESDNAIGFRCAEDD